MTIDSIEIVYLTCLFVLPGFIVDSFVNAFCPPNRRSEAIHFLYFLLYSIINFALLSWAYSLIWHYKDENLTIFILIALAITLLSATILGIIIGIFKSKELIRIIFNKLHLNIKSPIPTAWDFFFSHQGSMFVIITLQDDSKIYGLYGENSFTSTEPDERDIYLEKIYDIDEQNNWVENEYSLGIHILQNQIKTIEFLQGDFKNGKQ